MDNNSRSSSMQSHGLLLSFDKVNGLLHLESNVDRPGTLLTTHTPEEVLHMVSSHNAPPSACDTILSALCLYK